MSMTADIDFIPYREARLATTKNRMVEDIDSIINAVLLLVRWSQTAVLKLPWTIFIYLFIY